MKTREKILLALIIISLALLAVILSFGALGAVPLKTIRPLGSFYLYFMANNNIVIQEIYPSITKPSDFWAASTEGITAILWDYRGLDTLFETSVFFFAIIGSVSVFRYYSVSLEEKNKKNTNNSSTNTKTSGQGLSLIVKLITRINFVVIIAVSASIAFHGQLTPGGGFQGGATLAVAPLLAIAALSRYFVEDVGLKKNTMLTIRTLGLLIIGLLALTPLIMGFAGGNPYIMENQPKSWAMFIGFPSFGLGVLLGSLAFYNMAELLAVGAGFTVVFLLLTLPEEFFKKILSREVGKQ